MRGRVGIAVEANARTVPLALPRQAAFQRAVLVVALLALLLAAPSAARAQSTTPSTSNTSSLTTLSSPNGVITLAPSSRGIDRLRTPYTSTRPWWITYDDCIYEDEFTFSLTTTARNDNLEIWAGTENCATNRKNNNDRGQCWMVGFRQLDEDTVKVTVPVRNVLARILNTATLPGPLGPEVCTNSTEVNGEAISWYFMVVKGGQATEYFAWNGEPGGTGIDVIGPEPPDRISVGVGERQLSISMAGVPLDSTRQRFEAFCVPAGTLRPSSGADAGAQPAAGVGGSVASLLDAGDGSAGTGAPSGGEPDAGDPSTEAPAACFTDYLRVGERPPTEERFSCGTTNAISDTLRTKGNLVNDQAYAVAVSGQDELGNAGVISNIQCGTPMVLDDFYEMYDRNGGPGGGGFCTFAPPMRATGTRAGAVLLTLLVGFAWRRARGPA